MENGSEVKCPYLRYLFSGEIADRGIAFTVKDAIGTFARSHNLECKVLGFEASSDRFNFTLEIYDNGYLDFNMRALIDHLHSSGRLPTKESKKPALVVKPLPCNYKVDECIKPNSDMSYQKAIEDQSKQIRSLTTRLEGLESELQTQTRSLTESQKSNSDKENRISELERQIEQPIVKGDRPGWEKYCVDAALRLPALASDWKLVPECDRKNFIAGVYDNLADLVAYINIRLNTNFENLEKLNTWKKKFDSITVWEETDLYESYEAETNQLRIHDELLRTARKSGAAEDIVTFLALKVDSQKEKVAQIKSEYDSARQMLEKEKQYYDQLAALENDYKNISKVVKNSLARKLEPVEWPLSMTVYSKKAVFKFELPSIAPEDEFEIMLRSKLGDIFMGNSAYQVGYMLNQSDCYLTLKIAPEKSTGLEQVQKDFDTVYKARLIASQNFFRETGLLSLGVKGIFLDKLVTKKAKYYSIHTIDGTVDKDEVD